MPQQHVGLQLSPEGGVGSVSRKWLFSLYSQPRDEDFSASGDSRLLSHLKPPLTHDSHTGSPCPLPQREEDPDRQAEIPKDKKDARLKSP